MSCTQNNAFIFIARRFNNLQTLTRRSAGYFCLDSASRLRPDQKKSKSSKKSLASKDDPFCVWLIRQKSDIWPHLIAYMCAYTQIEFREKLHNYTIVDKKWALRHLIRHLIRLPFEIEFHRTMDSIKIALKKIKCDWLCDGRAPGLSDRDAVCIHTSRSFVKKKVDYFRFRFGPDCVAGFR